MNTTLKLVTKNRQKKTINLQTGKPGIIKFQENRGSVFVRETPQTGVLHVGWTLCFKGNGKLHGDKFNHEQARNLAIGRSYDLENKRLVIKSEELSDISTVRTKMREANIPDTLIPEILGLVSQNSKPSFVVSIFTKDKVKK